MSYENGKVYIIENDINDLVYIGSTIKPLSKRLEQHKIKSSYEWRNRFYHDLRFHPESFKIRLLTLYPCNTRKELTKEEGRYILMYESYKPQKGYNKNIAGRTTKEYYNFFRNHYIEYMRIYRKYIHYCPCCNINVTFDHISHHRKTKKHKRNEITEVFKNELNIHL